MSRKNLDDIFRDSLKNYDSDIDPNEIWAGIQDKQPNPSSDNKKPFPWWITGIGILATATLLLGLVVNNQRTTIETANAKISAMSALPAANEVKYNETKQAIVSNAESTNTITSTTPTTSIEEKKVMVSQSENRAVDKTAIGTNINVVNSQIDATSSTISNTANNNSKVNNIVESNLNTGNKIAPANSSIISRPTPNSFKTNSTNTTQFNTSNTTTNSSKVVIFAGVETRDAIPVIPMTVDVAAYLENAKLPIESVPSEKIAEGCYGGPAMSFAVGAHVSPDLVNHRISSANEALFPYIDERRKTENLVESYHGGLDIYFQHRDGLFIRTGVEYAQINRRFKFNETWVEFDSTNNITTTFEREKKTTNRYRLIDVPLTLGYEFNVNNGDLSLYVEAGASMNFFLSTKGDIINPNSPSDFYEPISITGNNDNSLDAYKDNVGISILGGIGLRYEYMDGLSFYVQPAGKLYLNSFTKDNNDFNEKFSRFGINLGVIYRL